MLTMRDVLKISLFVGMLTVLGMSLVRFRGVPIVGEAFRNREIQVEIDKHPKFKAGVP